MGQGGQSFGQTGREGARWPGRGGGRQEAQGETQPQGVCFTLLSATTLKDNLIEQMGFFFLVLLYHEKAHLPFNFYLIMLAVFYVSFSCLPPPHLHWHSLWSKNLFQN